MHRSDILAHLTMAQEHVAQGEEHIARQLALIGELERNGRDAGSARELLTQLEHMQMMHVTHRDRLQREAADQESPS